MPRNDLIPWKSLILDPAFPVFKDRIQSIFSTTETSSQCPGAELGFASHVAWLDWLRFEEFFSTSRRGCAPIHERLRSSWTDSVFLVFLSTATSDAQSAWRPWPSPPCFFCACSLPCMLHKKQGWGFVFCSKVLKHIRLCPHPSTTFCRCQENRRYFCALKPAVSEADVCPRPSVRQ